jgi:hypothetical protein
MRDVASSTGCARRVVELGVSSTSARGVQLVGKAGLIAEIYSALWPKSRRFEQSASACPFFTTKIAPDDQQVVLGGMRDAAPTCIDSELRKCLDSSRTLW